MSAKPTDGRAATPSGQPATTNAAAAAATSPGEIVGTVIHDKYEVLELLSQGGMGVVYKARHLGLDTLVALKVLLKPEEPLAQKRFLSEARLASKVRHPNTVYISDVGVLEDGRAFLEMELLEGRTLSAELQNGPIQVLRACQIAVQMARGLQAVHDKGIIHRDMKPDNVFLLEQDGTSDFVKIVDFGIAKVALPSDTLTPPDGAAALEGAAECLPDVPVRSGGYTLPGKVMGTPGFMAPEQLQAMRLDVRVDQYALGCILYLMISGRPVFDSRGLQTLMLKHLTDKPVPLRKRCPQAGVPLSLDALVMRLLAKDPQGRFASMREVEQELLREIERLAEPLTVPRAATDKTPIVESERRAPRWLWAAVAISASLAIGYTGYRLLYLPRHAPSSSGPIQQGPVVNSTEAQARELAELRRRALAVLREDLGSGSSELRWSALTALGQTRDPEVRSQLDTNLASPEPQARALAAAALGNLGDRRATPALGMLLEPEGAKGRTEQPQVKLAAAAALRQLGDPRGQRFLQQALDGKDADTQFRAALLLCEQGPSSVQRILRAYLQRSGVPETTLVNILACLARAGDAAALQRLRMQITDVGPAERRLSAAARLAQLGDADGLKYLRELSRKRGPEQLLAARELAQLDEPQGLELFRTYAFNREAQSLARQLACDGLGAVGEPADARRLAELLGDKRDAMLRQAAARAILEIAGRDPGFLSAQSMNWARAALLDSDALVRESAAEILGDSLSAGAVTLLAGLLKDHDIRVRRSAIIALGRRKDEAAVKVLRDALQDSDRRVRVQTLRSLLRMGDLLNTPGMKLAAAQVRSALSALMNSHAGQSATRESVLAAGLLLRLGDVSQVQRLRKWLSDSEAELRGLVLEQLPLTTDELARLLGDPAAGVRFLAARKLAALGDARALPVLQETVARGGADGALAYGLVRRLGVRPAATDPIERLLADPDPANRLEAVEALASMPAADAERYLARAARDREPLVRRMVAEVAAELADSQNGKPLLSVVQRLSADSDAAVRARSASLLARLLRQQEAAQRFPVSGAPAPPQPGVASRDAGTLPTGAADASAAFGPPQDMSSGLLTGAAPAVGDGGEAEAAAASEESAAPSAGASAEHGQVSVEAPPGVQFQIDRRPWQVAASRPISLEPGPHTINFLSGQRSIVIIPGQTTHVTITTSQIEQLARSGQESFNRSDYKKAQRQMEKAIALCSRDRDRQHVTVCANLSFDLVYRLGQIHERQKEWPEAMTEYQRLLSLSPQVRGKSDIKATAQAAVERLAPRLGQVIVSKQTRHGCQEETIWMRPGTHYIKADSKFEQIQVKARSVVRVGKCK